MSYDSQETSVNSGAPVECFKFTHQADNWRFTSADQPITLSVGVFQPAVIQAGERSSSDEDGSDAIDITVMRDNPIAVLLTPHRPVEPVYVTLYRAHRTDIEVITAWQGEAVNCKPGGATAMIHCAPMLYRLRNNVPSMTFQSQCNHALYGEGCTVDKTGYRLPGVVSTIVGDVITVGAAASQADGWWNNGYVERANGDRRFIINHVGAQLTLHWPFADLVSTESVVLYPGCDRTETVCAAKFSNLVNYGGFERIPTQNPFDGSIT